MTHALQSYRGDRWQDGTGEQRPLLATILARGPDDERGPEGER